MYVLGETSGALPTAKKTGSSRLFEGGEYNRKKPQGGNRPGVKEGGCALSRLRIVTALTDQNRFGR